MLVLLINNYNLNIYSIRDIQFFLQKSNEKKNITEYVAI